MNIRQANKIEKARMLWLIGDYDDPRHREEMRRRATDKLSRRWGRRMSPAAKRARAKLNDLRWRVANALLGERQWQPN